jgi:hypothetical protein
MGKPIFAENITYKKMTRLGKKENGESKVHATLAERMKPSK